MSGSGKTYKPTAPPNPCGKLRFSTTVNSPKSSVLAKVRIDTVLTIALDDSQQSVVVLLDGAVLGSLTGQHIVQLVRCLRDDFLYRGVVTQIQGGICIVEVEPAT